MAAFERISYLVYFILLLSNSYSYVRVCMRVCAVYTCSFTRSTARRVQAPSFCSRPLDLAVLTAL